MPTISVLMSTYNTPDDWLCAAIRSILDQTYTDYEFIIVDDCSSRNLASIQSEFSDGRIIWIRNSINLGLTKSLNNALKMSKGKYIARMDSDDISLPDRFALQVKYMDENPDVIVCGTYRQAFGDEAKNEIWDIPLTRAEQQVHLFFYNCGLTHPTVMFRKSMLDRYKIAYNESYIKAQDYGIWVQCTRYAPMAVIPKILLQYRKSKQQLSNAHKLDQRRDADKVKLDQLESLKIIPTEEEAAIHLGFCNKEVCMSAEKTQEWAMKLIEANRLSGCFDKALFEQEVNRRWFHLCKYQIKVKHNREYRQLYRSAYRYKFAIEDLTVSVKHQVCKFLYFYRHVKARVIG